MLVILSGVAGAGKDTIKKELIKRMENVESLPSYTSRPQRPGDVEGKTYNFVSKEEFEKMIEMVSSMNMIFTITIIMEHQKLYLMKK